MGFEAGDAPRVIRFEAAAGAALGLMRGATEFAPLPASLELGTLLAMSRSDQDAVFDAAREGPTRALDSVALTPLLSPGAAVWALALNYDTHIKEGGHARPAYPMLFLRLPASFAGHDRPLLKPHDTRQFDYEGELAIVIGKGGVDIPAEEAWGHVGGYTCCNEGSVREWQRHTSQITPGKNFWRSGSIGPWVQLPHEGFDPLEATLSTQVNGQEVQRVRIGDMLFSVEEVIAYVSGIAPLVPGDVILMGTPGGVGFRRDPQLFLEAGDEVRVEIEGLGALRNPVIDR